MTLLFYRCRWCGNVFEEDAPGIDPYCAVEAAIASEPDVDIIVPHQCDKKRTGVADLVGARKGGSRGSTTKEPAGV